MSDSDSPAFLEGLGSDGGSDEPPDQEGGGSPSHGEIAAAEDAIDAFKSGNAKALVKALRNLRDLG